MTIVAAKAIPYMKMVQLVSKTQGLDVSEAGPIDKVWVISVTDPDFPPIFPQRMANVLPMQFHDAAPFGPEDTKALFEREPHVILFSDEQAKDVVDFIVEAHRSTTNDLLLANCMMGISRSGAIVDFARQYCGLSYDTFKRMNPQIHPNSFVLRKLFDTLLAGSRVD